MLMKKILPNIKIGTKWRQNLIEYGTATLLISVVVWLVVIRNMNTGNDEIKAEIKAANTNVKKIQSQIDKVLSDQSFILIKTKQLEDTQEETIKLIEKGNSLLYQNKQAIEKIKIENNEKINRAGNYTQYQLDSFFTDRYQK